MKIAPERADAFAARPDARIRLALVYGPDEGLVRERVAKLVRSVVDDPNDPFRVAELTGARIKDDPALLADEAAALALTGGRRVVKVRDADDPCAKAIAQFLDAPAGDSLIVLQAGDLGARSTLRKAVEGSTIAAAVPCYLDEGQSLETVIRDTLAAHQIGVSRDAMDLLTAHLGGDRLVTRSEIEKLATYMGGPGEVSLEDALACVGDVSAMTLDDLSFAVADGEAARAQALLDRLLAEGKPMVSLLRTVSRHFMRLHLAGGAMAQGRSADQALALLKPPLFFKVKNRFSAQLRRWPPDRVAGALDILLSAQIDCMTTGLPDQEIGARALLQVSRAAARR
ncbi:DNA polymerase III subunit delta [Novispirillum sp. DQ9]|uniref:DNA polymerase III subunit delta n=1 Tax=Novispirillum sp. DQ9 TaxID=3398612 RepID=UPI003C7D337A